MASAQDNNNNECDLLFMASNDWLAPPPLDSFVTDGDELLSTERPHLWFMGLDRRPRCHKDLYFELDPDAKYIFTGSDTGSENKRSDSVSRQTHYTSGNIECIDAMETVFGEVAVEDFCILSCFKYLWERKYKGNERQDIEKALWYFDKYKEIVNGSI